MKRRNNGRKRRAFDVRKREFVSLIELETMNTFKPSQVKKDLTFDSGEDCRYREWTNRKWEQLTPSMKSAVVYHHKNQKVFALEGKLIDFLLPKEVSISDLDRDKLKGLPKCFILDLQHAENLISILPEEGQNIITMNEQSFPHAINGVMVFFEDKEGNLCEPQDYHRICMRAHYAYDPNHRHYENATAKVRPQGHPDRHYDIAYKRLFQNEDNFSVCLREGYKEKSFSILTLEEYKLAEIDNYCDEHEISEDARFAYSDAYLRACYQFLINKVTGNKALDNQMRKLDTVIRHSDNHGDLRNIGITDQALGDWLTEQKENKYLVPILTTIRKMLLTPMIDFADGHPNPVSILLPRRLVTSNIVLAFLKSLTEEQVITTEKRSFHPLSANRKRKRKSYQPITYSYITIDTQQLTTLRRERKSSVRRSDRYQTKVNGFKAFRWVTDGKLEQREDIFDLRENKTGTILYKVRRAVTGYTRNSHLPKKKKLFDDDLERRTVTKVKSFR